MYFSYSPSPPSTSYSTSTMDIPSTSSSSRPLSPSCAYPSWPQGASLSSRGCGPSQSTSFIISDEELFPTVFDDTEDCTPPMTPNVSRSPASPSAMYEPRIVVDHGSLMRDLLAQEKSKKEKSRRRKSSCSSKKSRSGSNKQMSPIIEWKAPSQREDKSQTYFW